MRRPGFRIVLPLILGVALLTIPFGNAIAAPPEKSWIHLTSIGEDNVVFDYGWNKVGVYSYSVYVLESGAGYSYHFETHNLGTRTTSKEDTTVSVTHSGIDSGDKNIYIRLWLYDKNGRMIKRARIDMRVEVP